MSYRPVYTCDADGSEFEPGYVFLQLTHDDRAAGTHTMEHLHVECFTKRMQEFAANVSMNWEVRVFAVRAL